MQHKTYLFHSPSTDWTPQLHIEWRDANSHTRKRNHALSEATYKRFVCLANSGNYRVSIPDNEDTVCWQLQRRAA